MAYKAKVLAPADGGTGVANNAASTITISGAFGATFTLTNTTSVTFPTSGTLATTAAIPALPLTVANGGTGVGTLTSHGVLLGHGTSNVSATAAGSAGQVLQSGGASADPTYSTATYPSTTTANQLLYSSATNTVAGLSNGTNGQILIAATSAAPAFGGVTSTGGSLTSTVGANTLNVDIASFVQSANYTPALTFGGGSTGITYATQLGRYTRICNLVFFEATIVLSAKGSSSGNAAISIPVASINSSVGKFICAMEATATMPASCTFFVGEVSTANSSVVSLVGCGGSTITNLTDGNFGASTTVRISGCYLAA